MVKKDRYYELVRHAEQNVNNSKNVFDWLDLVVVFNCVGKQGILGLVKPKDPKLRNTKIIFKTSQQMDNLVNRESIVMDSLGPVSEICPHFCRFICKGSCTINPRALADRDLDNIFKHDETTKYYITQDIILFEYIDESHKLRTLIINKKISEDVLYSALKQTIMAITIAHKMTKFTHYDLFSNNIIMKKYNSTDYVMLYILDENNAIAIPTFGYCPVIIDFGFSYIGNMQGNYMWGEFFYTEKGIYPDRSDWMSDMRRLLLTVSSDIKSVRNKMSVRSKVLRKVIRNIFNWINVDPESGWDKKEKYSHNEILIEDLRTRSKFDKSVLMYRQGYPCINMLQSLMILPLEKQDTRNFYNSFDAILEEWIKIENSIGSVYFNMYIFKGIVESARTNIPIMLQGKVEDAIRQFRIDVLKIIDEVSQYCNPKGVDYGKLLANIHIFTYSMEGKIMELIPDPSILEKRYKDRVMLTKPEHMYAVIDENVKSQYTYSDKTVVIVVDTVNHSNDFIKLTSDQADHINGIHRRRRGSMLNIWYQSKRASRVNTEEPTKQTSEEPKQTIDELKQTIEEPSKQTIFKV